MSLAREHLSLPLPIKGAVAPIPARERAANVLREPRFTFGSIPHAAGSCLIECGKTRVIAAIFGPQQHGRSPVPLPQSATFSEEAHLVCDVHIAPTARGDRQEPRSLEEQERKLSHILRRALRPALLLERYPKSVMSIAATVLSADGSVEGALVTAGSLAVADSGIDCKGLVVACCVAACEDKADDAAGATAEMRIDPTANEEARSSARTVVAMLLSGGGSGQADGAVSLATHAGAVSSESMQQALALCSAGCRSLYGQATAALRARTAELVAAVGQRASRLMQQ